MPVVPGVLDEALDLLEGGQHLDLVGRRQPPRGQRLVGVRLRLRLEASALADAVADHPERAGGGDSGVLLAQRARRCVARVGEDRLAGLGHRLVETLESLAGQEHLAPNLQQRGDGELLGRGQPVGHRRDGLDVRRDVLAGAAVTAGERPDQAALLVEQVDGQPVDLELAEQRRLLDAVARQSGVPGGELVAGERVVEALHPLQVVDRREFRRDGATDGLGR